MYRLMVAFFCLLLGATAALHAQNAADLLKQADAQNRARNFVAAERLYLQAQAAAPQEGFYAARLGQFYHYSTRDYEKAIAWFDKGLALGFDNSWMYTQAANSHRYLGRMEQAQQWFARGIESGKKRIALYRSKGWAVETSIDSLVGTYAQQLAMHLDVRDFSAARGVMDACLADWPATRNKSFLGYAAKLLYWTAMEQAVAGDYAAADRDMARALELTARDAGLERDNGAEYRLHRRLYAARAALGARQPLVTHRLLVALLPDTRARLENGTELAASLEPQTERMSRLSAGFMRLFVQTTSGGVLGLDFDIELTSMTMSALIDDVSAETEQRKNRMPDVNQLAAENPQWFAQKAAQYDSIVLVWASGEFNIANGGIKEIPLPGGGTVWRGYAHVPSARMIHNGPDLLLHEWFHTVERMTGLEVQHGYYPENRRHYPGWKGEGGNDYYWWQFSEYLPALFKSAGHLGWKSFAMRERHPLPQP